MEFLATLLQNNFALFVILVFIASAMLFEALFHLWHSYHGPAARKIERRLQALATETRADAQGSLLRQGSPADTPGLNHLLLGLPWLQGFARVLEQSGVRLKLARLLFLAVLAAAGLFVAGLVLQLPQTLTIAIAAIAFAFPFLHVYQRRARRIAEIERQLPQALDLIGRALRAGHAFSTGLQLAGEEMPEPIAQEFRTAHDEVNFGTSLQQALTKLAIRVPSTDVRYFVVAVLIQRETGGNLTEVLDKLSALIRERLKLYEKVRVLASEGTLSAWILSLLPFAVAGFINLIHPNFMKLLWTDPMGIRMVIAAAIMMLLGIVWMRRVVKIHV